MNFGTTAVAANLNVTSIAALPAEGSTYLSVPGGVPGFYYTLNGSATVDGKCTQSCVSTPCPTTGTVSFLSIKKPSEASGFFSIGAHAN